MRMISLAGLAALAAVRPATATADETSTGDKLRILYSSRFSFTDAGLPLVTVEIMGGQREVRLSAKGGVVARPDGAGGSTVLPGDDTGWTITARATKPAVVETLGPDDTDGVTDALARWKARGVDVRAFKIGTVFGVGGEVIDTREVRIAIDPVTAGKGAERAAAHARRYNIKTSVHAELV